ncbi:MAG: site-specific integrase [Oscillospiraceae bacterium]|nr:site-specific integrase [Mogibacterium sp.]MBR0341693.1 site-specific integrase [Oscillospiraceae bacterium]
MRRVKIEPRMFKPVRKKSSETQVFTKEELRKLKQVAWEDLEKPHHFELRLTPLAFLFMFQTGLRIGEVCAVRFGDIEGDELHLQRTVERDTKNIKDGLKGNNIERWVMLSSEAKRIIDEAKARQIAAGVYDEGYIFSMNSDCLSYRSVSESFRKYCEAAGINYRSSHKARKTFISTMLDGGMNINTVREMVGHADERTTMNSYCYDRHTKDERKDILEKALQA